MVKRYWWSVILVLVGLFVTSQGAGALPSQLRPAQGAKVVINEVQYDPPPAGLGESAYEWVELLNTSQATVMLTSWQLADSRSSDAIPDVELGPGEFLVVAGGEGFAELYPGFSGRLVMLGSSIGNGLANSGDQVRLLDADGSLVDGVSYGSDTGILDPSVPAVDGGHSLERVPAGLDTDTAADWLDQSAPSPGQPAGDARPTAAPTMAPPPTVAPGTGVVLNEYLPAPRDIDWDGDGQATAEDEWVELFNPGDVGVDLRGWQLDDVAAGGSDPYFLPEGTVLEPGGYLVIFRRDSRVALNNTSDSVRLLQPDGAVADETDFARSKPDASFARATDGSGAWTDALPPSPGRPNGDGTSPPDPSQTPKATPGGGTPPPTPSGGTAQPSPVPTAAGATPRPDPTPAPVFLPFLVSEVLFDPPPAGNDAASEWVELFNRSDRPANLSGWSIGDRTAWDGLPAVTVPPRGFVVIAATAALSATLDTGGAPIVVVADGRIGNGLANHGDVVRVRGPTGPIADAVSYGDDLAALDPAVPIGPPGSSIERLPPDVDTDSAEDWWIQPAPSAGRAGRRHEGPPRVVINELLPAPGRVDWDGNGVADFSDEWVELFNAAGYAVDLGGWRLAVGEPDRWTYELPAGWTLPAGGFGVIHRAESGLALGNDGDVLRLVRDDTVTADRFAWEHSPGYDRSWSRTADGGGEWTDRYAVTPSGPNGPPAARPGDGGGAPADNRGASPSRRGSSAAIPRAAALGELRALATGTLVLVRGRITAPPGVFGERVAYLGAEDGGVRLYLEPQGNLPAVDEGAWVGARGRLKDYHGERQLVLGAAADLWLAGPAEGPPAPLAPLEPLEPLEPPAPLAPLEPLEPLEPAAVSSGSVGEALEGRQVRLDGRVTRWLGASLWLDDGSGEARVAVQGATGLRRPWLEQGQWLTVVGIVGQYATRSPWAGGYRLMPRYERDFGAGNGRLPDRLPATGRAAQRGVSP